ncbi:MAG: hypothetical protein AB1744_14070, partial [Candidatus Zixiibacteriota bacterium]
MLSGTETDIRISHPKGLVEKPCRRHREESRFDRDDVAISLAGNIRDCHAPDQSRGLAMTQIALFQRALKAGAPVLTDRRVYLSRIIFLVCVTSPAVMR